METETNYNMLAYINSTFKADSIGTYMCIKLLICNKWKEESWETVAKDWP